MFHERPVPLRDLARRHIFLVLALAIAVAAMAACAPQPQPADGLAADSKPAAITRERAIEIARKDVRFSIDSVEAVRATSEGPQRQEVWRVTITGRLPDQPPGLFETRIFEVDVRTGEIVSGAMN